MVVGLCGLAGGAYLVGAFERFGLPAPDGVSLFAASCCSLGGMLALFAPLWFTKLIVWYLLGSRARETMNACPDSSTIAVEVSTPHREEMKISLDADDYGIVFADVPNRRLVIEALNARYQIRADDLISLEEFQFVNYLGAVIECEIANGTTLHIAIARMSLKLEFSRQVPLPIFRNVPNPVFEQCRRAIGRTSA